MKPILFSLFLAMGLTGWAQRPGSSVEARLRARHDSFPQEKIYLHHAKPAYLLGDDLWFKLYLTDARQHGPSLLSGLAYVELIGPADTVLARHHIAVRNGGGVGDFTIDLTGVPGQYRLRAYTQYMRNYAADYFFETSFPVYRALPGKDRDSVAPQPMDSVPFSVQFFPEGGESVAGLPGRLGIKAMDSSGRGIAVRGRILRAAGDTVATFQTQRFGLGQIEWQPLGGQAFQAEVEWQGQTRRFALPAVQPLGYGLRAEAQGTQTVITLRSNQAQGLNGCFLLGHLRGQPFCLVEGLQGSGQRLRLSLEELPEGIAHFTLFDAESRPVAERLVYVHQPDSRPQLSVTSAEASYGRREAVSFQLQLSDAAGQPLAGEVSLSVYDQLWQDVGQQQVDIRSYLLLSSDLRGQIEDPGYFFEEDDPGRRLLLDQLLLTQGWRRFTWPDLLANPAPELSYANQGGISFSGTIKGPLGRPTSAEVILTAVTEQVLVQREVTEEDGRFYFGGFAFSDTTELTLQAGQYQPRKERRKRRKQEETFSLSPSGNRNVDIELDEFGWPAPTARPSLGAPLLSQADTLQTVLAEEEEWRSALEQRYARIKEVDLDAVVIEGERSKPVFDRFDRPGTLYSNPDSRLILDSIPSSIAAQSIFDVLRGRAPGVEILGTQGQQRVRIRGSSSINLSNDALILLDGAPISNLSANTIDVRNVDYIDVVRGLRAASVFGEAGGNGVIAIYTRQGIAAQANTRPAEAPGTLSLTHPGFYQAREFYVPTYDKPRPESPRTDFRSPLYWNPKVLIDEQGQAEVEFFTADRSGSYLIEIQGISSTAQPVFGTLRWRVE